MVEGKLTVSELKEKYNLTQTDASKLEMLLLWFRDQNHKHVTMEEFDKRYYYLFRKRPLWYTWGPFYRDHGVVGIGLIKSGG